MASKRLERTTRTSIRSLRQSAPTTPGPRFHASGDDVETSNRNFCWQSGRPRTRYEDGVNRRRGSIDRRQHGSLLEPKRRHRWRTGRLEVAESRLHTTAAQPRTRRHGRDFARSLSELDRNLFLMVLDSASYDEWPSAQDDKAYLWMSQSPEKRFESRYVGDDR